MEKQKVRIAEALADYNRAIAVAPKYAEAYSNRALLKQQQGDGPGARRDIEKALELDPRIPSTYRARALLNENAGYVAGAHRDRATAAQLEKE